MCTFEMKRKSESISHSEKNNDTLHATPQKKSKISPDETPISLAKDSISHSTQKRKRQENKPEQINKRKSKKAKTMWDMLIGPFQYSGLDLYKAIDSGNVDKVKTIVSSFFCPRFEDICKEDAEQSLLLVAKGNLEIIDSLLSIYGGEFTDDDLIIGLIEASKSGNFEQLMELYCSCSDDKEELNNKLLLILKTWSLPSKKKLAEAFLVILDADLSYQGNEALYQALISNVSNSEILAKSFVLLANAKLSYQDNEGLYQALISNVYTSEILAKSFVHLANANLSYQDNEGLYQALISNVYNSKILAKSFVLLTKANLSYQDNEGLYQELISNKYHIYSRETLIKSFVQLVKADLSYQGNEELYQALISNVSNSEILAKSFVLLAKADLSYQDNEGLYQALISHGYHSLSLAKSFVLLDKANLSYQDNEGLYQALISNVSKSEILAKSFVQLAKANLSYQDNEGLYQTLISNVSQCEILVKSFVQLAKANLPYQGNEALYQIFISNKFNYTHLRKTLVKSFVLLANAKLSYQDNEGLYQALISNVSNSEILAKSFVLLANANLSYQDNEGLYQALISNVSQCEILAKSFVLLANAKLSYQDNEGLYQALISNASESEILAKCFVQLANANLSYQDNEGLYQALISKVSKSETLAKSFVLLANANLSYQDNEGLYQALISKVYTSEILAKSFVLLANANLSYQDNEGLYQALISKVYTYEIAKNSEILAKSFVLLANANLSYQDNPELYLALIKNPYSANTLAQCFVLLNNANLPYQDNPELYLALIKNPYSANTLAQGFVLLNNANLPYQDNPELYLALIKNPYSAYTQAQGFVLLNKANLSYQGNEALYQAIMEEICDAGKVLDLLNSFLELGIDYHHYIDYLNPNLFINYNLTLYVLTTLKDAGYSFSQHPTLLNKMLIELSQGHTRYQVVISIVEQLKNYALANEVKNLNEEQLQAVEQMVEEGLAWELPLTYGPLEKSQGTISIEKLLEQISQTDVEQETIIHFDSQEHYILKLPQQEEVNLSLLIENANLSQLTLSEECIDNLGKALNKLVTRNIAPGFTDNAIVKLLPKYQQLAINHYTSERYLNINKLFRGEPLKQKINRIFNPQADKNMLACFILGCLINDALNKLNFLVDNAPTEIPAPDNILLDRGERLSNEIIKRRTANPWCFPALTSFSVHKEGSAFFHNEGTTRTKLEQPPRAHVINAVEGEVIIPQGTQVITTQGPFLISTIINSPMLAPKNHYWSDLALVTAHDKYLSKKYVEANHAITLSGYRIERPNHNITHTYRVMLCTEHVSHYFAQHAIDEEFKAFCQYLSDEDREWLRVAAAFSITGRESEISASANLQRYDEYREASYAHFIKFVDATNSKAESHIKERMAHVVRYMGNPHYEQTINNHPDEKERQIRNYYHRLLSIAHKMDLPRCYTAMEYQKSMQICWDLSAPSDEQRTGLNEIIRYNIELIKAHGGALHCDIEADGTLINRSNPYQEIYGEVSHSMKRLYEVTQTVPKPQIEMSKKLRFGNFI